MAIYTESERQRMAREHLSDLLALERGLTEWEVDFTDAVAKRALPLAQAQMEKIYEIYRKCC